MESRAERRRQETKSRLCKKCKVNPVRSYYALYCEDCTGYNKKHRIIVTDKIHVTSCEECPFLLHCKKIVWVGPLRDGNQMIPLPCEADGEVKIDDYEQLSLI